MITISNGERSVEVSERDWRRVLRAVETANPSKFGYDDTPTQSLWNDLRSVSIGGA